MTVYINGTTGITTNPGTLISGSTIGVGGATPSASGAGITFPATQSASTDVNTLDDYEEGTWTPALAYGTPGTSSFTYNVSQTAGSYVKIGKLVKVSFKVVLTAFSKGTASGELLITGLPFTCSATDSGPTCSTLGMYDTPYNVNYRQVAVVDGGTTTMRLKEMPNNGAWLVFTDPDANSQYFATVVYDV